MPQCAARDEKQPLPGRHILSLHHLMLQLPWMDWFHMVTSGKLIKEDRRETAQEPLSALQHFMWIFFFSFSHLSWKWSSIFIRVQSFNHTLCTHNRCHTWEEMDFDFSCVLPFLSKTFFFSESASAFSAVTSQPGDRKLINWGHSGGGF